MAVKRTLDHAFCLAALGVGLIAGASSAAAQSASACSLSAMDGVDLTCTDEIQATLRVEPGDPGDVSVIEGGVITGAVESDFGGDDAITLNANELLGEDFLTFETVSGGDGAFGTVPNLDLGEGDDTVTVNSASISGTLFGGPGNDVLSINNTDVLPAELPLLGFNGGIGDDFVTVIDGTVGSLFGDDGNDTLRFGGVVEAGTVGGFETISLLDGVAGDSVTLDGLTLDDTRLEIDVDPEGAIGDSITIAERVSGAFEIAGDDNVLAVQFTQGVSTSQVVTLPVVAFDGEAPASTDDGDEPSVATPAAAPVPVDNVTVINVGENMNPLIGLSLLQGEDGGLFLEADVVAATGSTVGNVTAQAGQGMFDAAGDVANETFDAGAGLGGNAQRVAISPTFGVFANGSAGKTWHDGYEFTATPGLDGDTPSFDVDQFSVVGSGELDASAQFDLEDIGVLISAFGGYVYADLDSDSIANGQLVAPFGGGGTNRGGLFGGSLLVSKIQGLGNLNYAGLTAAGFLGETEFVNGATGGEGDYGTQGVRVGGIIGRNQAVTDDVRVDVRFTAAYNAFFGDGFTDTTDVVYGESETSFTQLGFETGLSTAFAVNRFVVRPTARLKLQHRFGYENTSSINGIDFSFDDEDLTVAAEAGYTTQITDRLSMGSFIEGRTNGDSGSIFTKTSLKYRFGGPR